MKKLKLSLKTKLLITAFIIILIILILSLSFLRKQEPTQVSTQPTPFPTITTYFSAPNNFIWQIDHLNLPAEVETISTMPNTQAKTILKNLSQKLNFKEDSTVIPNTPIIIYSNPLEASEIYLNTADNFIKFDINLLQRPIPVNNVQQNIVSLLQESLDLPKEISINKNSTHYQNIVGPRFVNTTKDKAALIKTTYNYSIKSLPILFPEGNSIETIHSLSGTLVKLFVSLPPVIPAQTKTHILPVKTTAQIKSTPTSQFITLTLSGNQQFTLSDQEINIDTAVINNGFLGYIYSSNTLIPHIFLTGVTDDPQYGQIELLLATPANNQ